MQKKLIYQRLLKWFSGIQKKVKKRIKAINKKTKGLRITVTSYAKFYFKYYLVNLKNIVLYFIHIKLLTVFGLSIIYFLIVGLTSFVIGSYIDPVTLNPQALTYFIAVAAMIGGIIALIFPFKILIMQNAAENTSAGFYRTLGKDRRQDIVFFVIVFSVLFFFFLALTATSYQFTFLNQQYNLLRITFQFSIFIIGLDFYLIFVLFEMLFKRTDPLSAIIYLQDSSVDYLDDIYKKAVEYSELRLLHPKTDKNITKEEMLASSFLSFQTGLRYLSYRLNYLFDYHDKVLAKNERTASLSILDAITSILKKYFVIRKDSSVLLPSEFFFVSSSDSQAFLTPHLESLISVGENYLKKEDSAGVKKIIILFQELILYAGEIKFVGVRTHDNPILMQLRGYLDQFMTSIMQKGFLEGMFQGAISYKGIGAVIIKKKMIVELKLIFGMLNKIAYAALLIKQDVVVSEVIKSYSALLTVLSGDDWLFKEKLDLLLEHLQETIIYGFATHKSRAIPHGRMQQELAAPYEVLADIIIQKAESVLAIRDVQKKEEAKSLVIATAEELRLSLRQLSESLKSADSLIIGIFGNIIRRVGTLLIHLTTDSNWSDAKHALEREGNAYLHLPWWFTDGVNKIDDSLSFDELPEAVAKMGIVALDSNQDGMVEDSVKVISDFATGMLVKEDPPGIGLTEPRIMVLACYLGIYALKLGKTEIVIKLKTHIQTFEQAYLQKYFNDPRADLVSSPRRDQLMREVIKFIDELTDFNRIGFSIPSTEDLLVRILSEEDVKIFVKEIWNVEI